MDLKRYLIIWLLLLSVLPLQAQKGKEHVPDVLPQQLVGETEEELSGAEGSEASAALSPLAIQLNQILQSPLLETAQVGLMVWDLTADSCLFRYHERWRMRPASTQKLVTAITALDLLGADYKLQTRLCYTGSVNAETRTLVGDLYCIGGMDSGFGLDDLKSFVNAVKALGVDTIRGNIMADKSFKDDKLYGEGWCWDDENPVLSPLLLNKKNDFAVRFLSQLRSAGIFVDAGTGEQVCPATARQIRCIERPMTDILQPMMKKSDNLSAEVLFYQIAHQKGGTQAGAKSAKTVIEQVMRKAGLTPAHYYVADGSGLSLYNYASPEMQVLLLRYAHQHPTIYQSLAASLPVAGVDGTLSARMRSGSARGNVRAKTGTVTGVSSLAGYCTAANGHKLCFSVICQGQGSAQDARNLQDRICQQLCQ